jgi:hypothetical protein
MKYQTPRPKIQASSLEAFANICGGILEQPITMLIGGVQAGIGPAPDPEIRGARQRVTWWYGAKRGNAIRADVALQQVIAEAVRADMPAPLELSEFEERRAAELVAEVDKAAAMYRDLLGRRTGVDWSVRVGRGKARSTISIMSEPKHRVGGQMTARDAALLAALTGREFVNPASGIVIPNSARARLEMASYLAGVELVADRRAAQ